MRCTSTGDNTWALRSVYLIYRAVLLAHIAYISFMKQAIPVLYFRQGHMVQPFRVLENLPVLRTSHFDTSRYAERPQQSAIILRVREYWGLASRVSPL